MKAQRFSMPTALWLAAFLVNAPAVAQPAGPAPAVPRAPAPTPAGPFLVKPYLQLGDAPTPTGGDLCVLWHAEDADADWSVGTRASAGSPWRPAPAPTFRRVDVGGLPPHRVYKAMLAGLAPGAAFEYRVGRGGSAVFEAEGRGRKGADQPYRFAAYGDVGVNSAEERAVARQAIAAKPDFVMLTGDIVYDRGRDSEYRTNFWPVYNSEAGSAAGVPLMRSVPFTAAAGNHDVLNRDLAKYPDGLAYFYLWDQPLNGPVGAPGGPLVPELSGPEATRSAFAAAAGPHYPGMTNFSFDYGNAHWTVLDANPYVDWTDPALVAWVGRDLAAARGATWRFVSFHQPGFNSARAHFKEQQMRLLAPTFEAGGVDLVFNGHVHNYQRSYPLRFAPDAPKSFPAGKDKLIPGRWTLDRAFDGLANTRPSGVIYLVTGGGGADLYNPEQQDHPKSWQEFTAKFISKVHSLTLVDVDGPSLTVRQLSDEGAELDRFVVNRPATAAP